MMTSTNNSVNSRHYSIGFSLAGSLIIIMFLAFINFSTEVSFPWFIFPAYAVLWWPITTIFIGKHSMKMLSLIGSLATIALLVIINYLTSWNYPWFLFPSFAILWWPFAALFGIKRSKALSVIGSLVIITFSIITNYITTPSVIWFYYPAFVVLWWPLSLFFSGPRTIKLYSVLGSMITIAFLSIENVIKTPNCPWALLTYFPVLMWPVGVLLGKRLGKLSTALTTVIAAIIYYTVLNMYVFKGFPWVIFPIYALLWWPLSIAFAKRGRLLIFSVIGSLMTAALFIIVNLITTPNNIWAVYPIFAITWWPLSIYYFVHQHHKADAV